MRKKTTLKKISIIKNIAKSYLPNANFNLRNRFTMAMNKNIKSVHSLCILGITIILCLLSDLFPFSN